MLDAAIVLQGAVGDQEKITPLVTILPALIAKSASIANPIIYAISHPKYRLVYMSTLYLFLMLFNIIFGLFASLISQVLQRTIPWCCINEKAPPSTPDSASTTGSIQTTSTENS